MAKQDTREPTLADRVILAPPRIELYPTKTVDQIRGRIRGARRFVFDTEASRRAGDVVREVPDLLYREQQFARAPYDLTWIEYDAKAFWESAHDRAADERHDTRIGFLIDHGTAYSFVDDILFTEQGTGRQRQSGAIIQPFVYDLHRPWERDEELRFAQDCGTSRGMLDAFTWGSSLPNVPIEQRRLLRTSHTIRLLPVHPEIVDKGVEIYRALASQCVGDLRNVIALLLLMNRPSLTTYVRDVPHWKKFVRGKLRPYMAHSVVTIPIDPVPTIRKLGTVYGDAVQKRRHEVRGVYCHDEAYRKGTKAGCIHEWTEHPDYVDEALNDDRWHVNEFGNVEFDNWQCTRCGGHRWYRIKHERGDAAVGYVRKEYRVVGRAKA